jgi:hypothetical protein
MPRLDPHHRVLAAELARTAGTTPVDARVRALLDVTCNTSKNDALRYAWDKYQVPFERTIIESYLLAGTPLEEIQRVTGVPLEALQAYVDHIFDITMFRDLLEKVSYVNRARGYLPREQQAYLEAALSLGTDYISWLLNREPTPVPKAVLEDAMSAGHFLGRAHRSADPTSELAKQSQRWLQSGAQAAAVLMKLDPRDTEDALANLRMALMHRDSVVNAQTAGAPQPEDIVH